MTFGYLAALDIARTQGVSTIPAGAPAAGLPLSGQR
jgi:hypothetical protein